MNRLHFCTALLYFVTQITCREPGDPVDVKGSIKCANEGEDPCSEWTASFTGDSGSTLTASRLKRVYGKTFGRFSCDFYINHKDALFAFLNVCEEGSDNIKSFSGMFNESDSVRYMIHYDRKEKKQRLIFQDMNSRGLSEGARRFGDDKSNVGSNLPFRWDSKTNKKENFTDPTIELAVLADHALFQYYDEDEDLTQMMIHQMVNGARALFQKLSIDVIIASYVRIPQNWSKYIMQRLDGTEFRDAFPRMRRYYDGEVKAKRRIRGDADLLVGFTHRTLGPGGINGQNQDEICGNRANTIVVVYDEKDYREGTMYQQLSSTTAHEMAHSLNIWHDHEVPGCTCPRSNPCVMERSYDAVMTEWSACSSTNVSIFLEASRENWTCLFTKDVYFDDDNIAVTLNDTYSGDDDVYMTLSSKAFDERSLSLRKSFNLKMGNDSICSYFHNKPGTPFAAFHWCGPTANHSHWFGVFHSKDSQVEIIYREHSKSYIASVSEFKGENLLPLLQLHPNISYEISVDQAINATLKQKIHPWYEVDYKTDYTLSALHFAMGAVNRADALLRLNNVRLRTRDVTFSRRGMQSPARIELRFSDEASDKHKVYPDPDEMGSECGDPPDPDNMGFDSTQSIIALQVAHTIGHTMSMPDRQHTECDCATTHGLCFMHEVEALRGFAWSSCDVDQFKKVTLTASFRECDLPFVKVVDRRFRNHRTAIIVFSVLIALEVVCIILLIIGQCTGFIRPFC